MSSDTSPAESMNARLWALILLLPALAAFGGRLGEILLYARWLTPAAGETETVWSEDVAPIVTGLLVSMLVIASQMIIIAKTYRIDIFPVTYSLRATDNTPLAAMTCVGAFLAAMVGAGVAGHWVAPLLFAGRPYGGAFTSPFMVLTGMAAGMLIAPMIVHGERLRTKGESR